MNDEMVNPRDLAEKCYMNSAESRQLKADAQKLGISKTNLLRLCYLKWHREQHGQELLVDSGLVGRADVDRD